MDRADLEKLLAGFFASSACPLPVDAAYLFGSRARETGGPRSDVDVAVLFSPGVVRGWPTPELSLKNSLESFAPVEFDVVSMREAPPDLVHRILRDGRLVHEANRRGRIAFEIQARNEFFDLEPILRRYRRPRISA